MNISGRVRLYFSHSFGMVHKFTACRRFKDKLDESSFVLNDEVDLTLSYSLVDGSPTNVKQKSISISVTHFQIFTLRIVYT